MSRPDVRIVDRSREALEEVGRLSHEALTEMAETMVEQGKENAPFRTGHLKGSIRLKGGGHCAFEVFTETGGGEHGDGYGAFVELGTSRMAAQPYLGPALEQAKKEMEKGGRWK